MSHPHPCYGVNLTDCTNLYNRLKIALVLDALKIECIPFDHFWTNGAYSYYDPLPGLPDSTITEL